MSVKPQIAAIQMTAGSTLQENLNTAEKLVAKAASGGAQLVVLPEMFATMALTDELKVQAKELSGSGPLQDFLHSIARKYQIWLVGGTIPLAAAHDTCRARAACLILNDQGEVVARYDKIHLFDAHLRTSKEAYLESRTTEPGDKVVVVPTPFGRLGIAVCYDIRFPEMFRRMHAQGVDVIAVPTAFTYTTGAAHWDVLVRARAIENLAYVVAACQTGMHPNQRRTFGHSMVVNPWGEVMMSLPDGEGVVLGEIDADYLREIRQDFPVLLHRKL